MTTKTKSTIKLVVNILLWVFLAFAAFVTILAFMANSSGKGYPTVGGKAYFGAQSNSMKSDEGFKKGDLIICDVLGDNEKGTLEVGDVITFYHDLDGDGQQELNTHRIISVNKAESYYKTKGDNNLADDDYNVYFTSVEAKWTGKKVSGLGNVVIFSQSSIGFLCGIVIPVAVIFAYLLVTFIGILRKYLGKRTITKDEEEDIKQRAIEEYLLKHGLSLPQDKKEETKSEDSGDNQNN